MKDDDININKDAPELKEIKPDAAQEVERLTETLAAAEKKVQENWDLAVRARAELDNVQKRAKRDVEQAHKYALEQFAKELLPVIDSLEQGLAAAEGSEQSAESLQQGMELTLKMLLGLCAKFSIEQINPEKEAFNPTLHEAMTMQETDEAETNTVLIVIQKGYTLHGRLLRPARVVVAK
jgi:molecular chaperone GrpE